MKKAKFALSVAGVTGIIAGALAFKAQHKFTGRYFCTAAFNVRATNPVRYTTTNLGALSYCTTVLNQLPSTLPYTVEPNA